MFDPMGGLDQVGFVERVRVPECGPVMNFQPTRDLVFVDRNAAFCHINSQIEQVPRIATSIVIQQLFSPPR